MKAMVFWPAAATVAATALLVAWRGFFWQHALLVGLAVGALVYSVLRTTDRLRRFYRR